MNVLTKWIVLHRRRDDMLAPYEFFVCQAENMDHAEEQCETAEPGSAILWALPDAEPNEVLCDYLATV